MRIGVPKEIKDHEYRVALTPAGADALTRAGHRVIVEAGAGNESGFADEEYRSAGAELLVEASAVWETAEMIMKVKEPQPAEYRYFRKGLLLFTYLHLAAEPELTEALLQTSVTSVAYETIQSEDGSLPLLQPMSEIAGRMSVQIGARLLEKLGGGRGRLLGGVPGVSAAHVVILGAGVVGSNAAAMAVGLGARTTVLDVHVGRLRTLDEQYRNRITTIVSSPLEISEVVPTADLFISAILLPGKRSPKLLDEETVRRMKPGSVIVDVGVDQGSAVATMDRVTTHSHPTFTKHGVIHFGVANIPGAVPHTSTRALANATLPYAIQLAGAADLRTVAADTGYAALAKGINTIQGTVVHPGVAEAHGVECRALSDVLLNW